MSRRSSAGAEALWGRKATAGVPTIDEAYDTGLHTVLTDRLQSMERKDPNRHRNS
jgi:hypothetical protein